jgi:hypothetical protein
VWHGVGFCAVLVPPFALMRVNEMSRKQLASFKRSIDRAIARMDGRWGSNTTPYF